MPQIGTRYVEETHVVRKKSSGKEEQEDNVIKQLDVKAINYYRM